MSANTDPGRAAEEMRFDDVKEADIAAEARALCAAHCTWGQSDKGPCSECTADREHDWLQDAAATLATKRINSVLAQLQADLIAARKERDEALKLRKEDRAWYEMTVSVVEEQRENYRAEAAQLHARLHEAEKGREGSRRDPGGSGSQASPEAAPHLRPEGVDPSRMQWQPIATVPIGEEVLLFGGRYALTKTRRGRQVGTIDDLDFMQRADGSFYPSAPTHWAPLIPEPPALGIEAAVPPEPKGPAEGESPAPTGAMPDPLTPAPEANQEAGDGR